MTIEDLRKKAREEGAAWLEGDGWGMLVEPEDPEADEPDVSGFRVSAGTDDVVAARTLERLAASALYYAYYEGRFGGHVPDPLFAAATVVAQALEGEGARVVDRGKWETEVPEGAVA